MQILHYSDKTDPTFITQYPRCDVVVATGDLMQTDFSGLELITERKPAFGVYGNHDSGTYMGPLGIINLHCQMYEYAGLTWGGFQGCLRYKKNGEYMFVEDEAKIFYETFPSVDVLLLHAGPKAMLDDPSDDVHIGSEWIARYVTEKQPKYIFCGHQYSNAEMTVGNTRLFRTYGARMISIDL